MVGHAWREQPENPLSNVEPVKGAISVGNVYNLELLGGRFRLSRGLSVPFRRFALGCGIRNVGHSPNPNAHGVLHAGILLPQCWAVVGKGVEEYVTKKGVPHWNRQS